MHMKGNQSMVFDSPVYIISNASIVGKKEGEGPLANDFDLICDDAMFGEKSWEMAESTLQKEAVSLALGKASLNASHIRYLFAGDLLSQLIATSFGLMDYNIPLFGLYGACSTCGEALGLGAMCISGGFASHVLALTSSHFASAEKQFRFPLQYGNQRPACSTYTVTGSGAFVLSDQPTMFPKARITAYTPGRIVDYGVKDSMNMGACMAPAACDVIASHLHDFERTPSDYDKIITGDLGTVGQALLLDLLSEQHLDIHEQHMDCGIEIFDGKTQETSAGGSGCGCSAVVLSAMILKKLESGAWKRVLFIPTGALLSTVSFNEGKPVPGIAHAVVLESP